MNNTSPLISIIVPVYNAEKYIERALLSLINQTYKNIEILCINDGSLDNSYSILQMMSEKDKRIRLFNKENSGPAATRNVGLKNALGEYIMFCDADDYYEHNMCELMLSTILEQQVDIVMCDCNIINTYNLKLRKEREYSYMKLKFSGIYYIGMHEYIIINSLIWNKIFKKNIIDLYKIIFPDGHEHDDYVFLYKYLSCSNICYGLNIKLYNYEISNSNSVMALYYTNKVDSKKKLDFLISGHDVIEFVIKNQLRHQVIASTINLYKETVISFASSYLNKSQLLEMVKLQKEFFKDKNQFDDFDYVREIKNESLQKLIKRYEIKLTPLEWIFSVKNKSLYEKIITIFGLKIIINRYKNNY